MFHNKEHQETWLELDCMLLLSGDDLRLCVKADSFFILQTRLQVAVLTHILIWTKQHCNLMLI